MENSEILLGYALQALRETNVTPSDWAVGGGTVFKIKTQFNKFVCKFNKLDTSRLYSTIYQDMLLENGLKIKGKEFYICKKFIRKANEIEHDRCR